MAKKFLISFLLIAFFAVLISPSTLYATSQAPTAPIASVTPMSNSIDDLDNRSETENLAGITADKINEMAQNSPNSLTPIQGLVLWMFVIIAFLKLAQKMDNLLQSLGLNVTQTGGRAVGDLIMAGMALKHVGGAISKGVGMFGFGGKGGAGGASGSSSASGTSTGSSGSAPIPTSGPGSSPAPMPLGSSPGGFGGSATPLGGSPAGATPPANPSTATSTTPSGVPLPSGAAQPATGAVPASRNPIGKAVEWMRGDGFAQGAVKAGAKGGLIGVGAYSAKIGAAKVGSAISARFGGDAPSDPLMPNNSNDGDNLLAAANNSENREGFRESRPLNDHEDRSAIPANINSEDYQETRPLDDFDESVPAYPRTIEGEYNKVGSQDAAVDSQSIPTTIGGADAQDVSSDSNPSHLEARSIHDDNNSEPWQSAKSPDAPVDSPPIPSAKNEEKWHDSSSATGQTSAIKGAASAIPTSPTPSETTIASPQPATGDGVIAPKASMQAAPPALAATAAVPLVQTDKQANSGGQAQTTPHSPQVSADAEPKKSEIFADTKQATAQSSVNGASVPSTSSATTPTEGTTVSNGIPSAHEESVSHDISSSSDNGEAGDASMAHNTAHQTPDNQAISAEIPRDDSAVAVQDASNGDAVNTSAQASEPVPIQQASNQPSNDVGANAQAIQSDTVNSIEQNNNVVAAASSESAPATQDGSVAQSQITKVNNETTLTEVQQVQPTPQSDVQSANHASGAGNQTNMTQPSQSQPNEAKTETSRPTAKGKSKNAVAKGRKKRR